MSVMTAGEQKRRAGSARGRRLVTAVPGQPNVMAGPWPGAGERHGRAVPGEWHGPAAHGTPGRHYAEPGPPVARPQAAHAVVARRLEAGARPVHPGATDPAGPACGRRAPHRKHGAGGGAGLAGGHGKGGRGRQWCAVECRLPQPALGGRPAGPEPVVDRDAVRSWVRPPQRHPGDHRPQRAERHVGPAG